MFTTILVGVDDRQGGRDALDLGRHLADLGGGELLAVLVYPYEPFPTLGLPSHVDAIAREEARRRIRAQVDAAGIDARIEVRADTSPGRGLHRAAEAADADIVVVGSSHHGALGRIIAGDNTRAMLQGAGTPVVVARPAGSAMTRGRVFGVGYDGSPESEAALAWAGQLAESANGTVRVLCVAEPPQAFSPSISYGINWVALEPERKEQAERFAAEAAAKLGGHAIGEAVVGMATEELLRLSRVVDLLVLGSRGYGPVRRTLLGSTSDSLVHKAECPVVVLPRGAVDRMETEERATVVETTT
jgi:nucleotide-binding universal stress UspA family protein